MPILDQYAPIDDNLAAISFKANWLLTGAAAIADDVGLLVDAGMDLDDISWFGLTSGAGYGCPWFLFGARAGIATVETDVIGVGCKIPVCTEEDRRKDEDALGTVNGVHVYALKTASLRLRCGGP